MLFYYVQFTTLKERVVASGGKSFVVTELVPDQVQAAAWLKSQFERRNCTRLYVL